MSIVHEFEIDSQCSVTLSQRQRGRKPFKVTYGAHVVDGLNYSGAAFELGCCLMHALACNGACRNDDQSTEDE